MKVPTPLYLDFEFTNVSEQKLRLVSCVTFSEERNELKKWWLDYDPKEQENLKSYLSSFELFISYSAVAECRSFYSLGLNPLDFKWIDLFIEYRCLTNNNDSLMYGKQLVDGEVKMTYKPKPKWERTEEDEDSPGFKPNHSLAEATYKLLGEIRDTEHKTKMRNLIISGPASFSKEERNSILEYGVDDVTHLPALYREMKQKFFLLDPSLTKEGLLEDMLLRGRYSAHTSRMETFGYPINLKKTKNFSKNVGNILFDCQRDINEQFPDIVPFKWSKKDQKFSWDQNKTREWVTSLGYKDWTKTDTGKQSLSLEAFTKYFDFKHDYPRGNFGAQIVRFLKLKQSLYGFVPTKDGKRKNFWDSVGKDGRVRPYMNHYGAQSSRSQPSSTGFMFLKPAWMRALVEPVKGYALGGIDFGSQEFLISALESGDMNMINTYLSGDVYLGFYKAAGIVPKTATKESHKAERETAKSTVLGISYLMTKYGLALKLSSDTGKKYTEEEAQEQIDIFYETFPVLEERQHQIIEEYKSDGFIRLPDGWYMWGDNENFRSVVNCPIQGRGGVVMRKAVDLAYKRGLYVPFTLHDALYIEFKRGNEHEMEILEECMREAFVSCFPKDMYKYASKIKLDPFIWGPEYEKDSEIVLASGKKIPCSNLYLDERAKTDYDAFSKYFEEQFYEIL
jgi:hypothetical protein